MFRETILDTLGKVQVKDACNFLTLATLCFDYLKPL